MPRDESGTMKQIYIKRNIVERIWTDLGTVHMAEQRNVGCTGSRRTHLEHFGGGLSYAADERRHQQKIKGVIFCNLLGS